jgi:hypothetical protein
MSSSHTYLTEEVQTPSYPTFEALKNAQLPVWGSFDSARCIFWTLHGPLKTAISVMPDYHSPTSLEPYFQETPEGGIWHPISQLPVTEPKVSSMIVRVDEFETWEYEWLQLHTEGCNSDAQWGPLPYAYVNPDPEDEGREHLLFCCGEERPRMKNYRILVTPANLSEGFVTVHDYLSTVHPWIMSLRDELVKIARACSIGPTSTADMMVDCNGLDNLRMSDSASWIKHKSQNLEQLFAWDAKYASIPRPQFGPELPPTNFVD